MSSKSNNYQPVASKSLSTAVRVWSFYLASRTKRIYSRRHTLEIQFCPTTPSLSSSRSTGHRSHRRITRCCTRPNRATWAVWLISRCMRWTARSRSNLWTMKIQQLRTSARRMQTLGMVSQRKQSSYTMLCITRCGTTSRKSNRIMEWRSQRPSS